MKSRNTFTWKGWTLEKASPFFFTDYDCGDADLNDYFLKRSGDFREELLTQTYAFYEENDPFPLTVALVDFCNDSIPKEMMSRADRKKIDHRKRGFQRFPSVKITRLGVHTDFQRQHMGTRLLETVKHFFLTDNRTGCRFITVDAYRAAVPFYEKNGFHQMLVEEEADSEAPTVPLFFDLKSIVA